MLLSAIDPALLIYQYNDWLSRQPHCFKRFAALTLHRRMIREYGQKMAISMLAQHFPWNENYRTIAELRDLRQFILEELQRAYYIDKELAGKADLKPAGITCLYVEKQEVVEAWIELLFSCVDEAILSEFDTQIATWEMEHLKEHSAALILMIHDIDTQIHELPIVWDEDSWIKQLATQDWWPDLRRCVELYFKSNSAMKDHPKVREQPLPFESTEAFGKSIDRYCTDVHLRRSFIEALTKRVYGVLDASLGDEALGKIRRFRVTDFWRVHYRVKAGRIVLEEFGPHSIGGVR
jgi:hypothetical protein